MGSTHNFNFKNGQNYKFSYETCILQTSFVLDTLMRTWDPVVNKKDMDLYDACSIFVSTNFESVAPSKKSAMKMEG